MSRPPEKVERERAGARPAATTKLLAGGNPQNARGDGDAPVRSYLEALPGWKRDVGHRLDALIRRAVPEVSRAVRWNSPFYGIKGRGWFLAFHCLSSYLKVAFFNGASLRPMPPVASKNEGTRYLHLREGEELDEELLTRWVRQAAGSPPLGRWGPSSGWVP